MFFLWGACVMWLETCFDGEGLGGLKGVEQGDGQDAGGLVGGEEDGELFAGAGFYEAVGGFGSVAGHGEAGDLGAVVKTEGGEAEGGGVDGLLGGVGDVEVDLDACGAC